MPRSDVDGGRLQGVPGYLIKSGEGGLELLWIDADSTVGEGPAVSEVALGEGLVASGTHFFDDGSGGCPQPRIRDGRSLQQRSAFL